MRRSYSHGPGAPIVGGGVFFRTPAGGVIRARRRLRKRGGRLTFGREVLRRMRSAMLGLYLRGRTVPGCPPVT